MGRGMTSWDADTAGVISRHGKRDGIKADRKFERVRAFSAKLDAGQREALLSDPSVVAVVPDEVIERFCLLGAASDHIARIRELESLGVDQFAVYLMHDQMDETLASYGRDIIPAFR